MGEHRRLVGIGIGINGLALCGRDHIAENRQLVEHRIQSLTVSHRARCKSIEDQVARAMNDKIRLMKESELARANVDFNRRMAELQQAANSGDIRSTPVVFGTISVTGAAT
jgi:ATP-dependent helicase HepA